VTAVVSRALRHGCGLLICLSVLSCGGGGGSISSSSSAGTVTPAANVVGVVVDGGPNAPPNSAINTLYTTVTVCVPGSTTNCQTIDDIQVDTGSYGLRLLAPVLTLTLPVIASANGASLVECTTFVKSYSWGPVALLDVQISGESAHAVPVQLIGDTRFPTVPSDCSSSAPAAENTVAQFGAKGILGIGFLAQDCGSICVNTAIPAAYYSCTKTACQATTVALTSQVQNPVPLFTTDNDGTIIELPSVAAGGATSVTGSLIFGIDTQSNNQSGSQTVLTLDPSTGELTTVFNGQTLSTSFIDSGSNGIFFNDSSIMRCPNPNAAFYCPASTQKFSATLQGASGTSVPESFNVASVETIASTVTAFPDLAGSNPTAGSFDWGLPFFYNRRVATAIEGHTTSAGTGPYVAF
jgi:hypothetical protein